MPPLRYRRDDIAELAEHFAQRMCRELGYDWFAGFDRAALAQLLEHDWPGNVRELKNVVERSVYRNPDPAEPVRHIVLDPFEAPWRHPGHSETDAEPERQKTAAREAPAKTAAGDLRQRVAEYEQRLIRQALEAAQFNQRRAAEALGLTYHQLRASLRKYPGLLSGGD
ncbi:helix-turn-helix domain-containing protein [Marinobacterium aestuariivivens]|uniref:Helix-turn-helix domain-containing protein n=1 Tax=Marinobacterium aestuariivivens TaxID=1698799 RepID=A0ABW2A3D9_9GAMM